MDENYSKVCPVDGWSISFPEADNYETCPLDGTPLKTLSATEALDNAITVTGNTTSVSCMEVMHLESQILLRK